MRDDGSQHHLDELIDDTARSMTDGMPSGSLRAGVRERIRTSSGSASGAWAWRLGVAATSIAFVVLVVARNLSTPLEEQAGRQPAQDIELRARTDPDVARLDVVDANASRRTAAGPSRPAATASTPSTGTTSTSTREFQTVLPDRPGDQLPFPAMELETVAIEPLTADAVMVAEIELPMPLQVPRLNIAPVVTE